MTTIKDAYSTDSESTDDTKRKRGEEDEIVFSKSKKISRTPVKEKHNIGNVNVDMAELKELMTDMIKEHKNTKKEQEGTQDVLREMLNEIKEIRSENKEMKKHFAKLEKENEQLKVEMKELKDNMENMKQKLEHLDKGNERFEREKRRKNIIVKGLKMDGKDSRELINGMQEFIKANMDTKPKIKQVQKLNDTVWLIETETWDQKLEILKNKKKLKDTEWKNVYFDNDLTIKERFMQKAIRDMAATERKKGNRVKVSFNKLTIIETGAEWRWNREKEKLEMSKNYVH